MSDAHGKRPEGQRPQNQTGEDKGTIKSQQRTGRTPGDADLAQGSEPEARASSRGR